MAKDIKIEQHDGITVVSLDQSSHSLFEGELAEISEVLLDVGKNADPPFVVIDLPHIKFAGSAFLALLARVAIHVSGRKGRFAVSSLSPFCATAVRSTKLDQVFDVFDSLEDALQQLKA